ncbi:MAG: TRAP transporter small permease [Chromatiaceae bacterium]|nr:TRAP transporter small permease [Gammaproteobacteria bacterium]MCP5428030.1 TRAP transporter small permease [Chromatiaceae bacterium]MCB1861757.1 TRAP transporter small permease [Gammaproteobacteria bacterium]MCB1874171.1 TRAP transporter small permease [Gammaproteobacteria bacterium]MCB1881601.1 TRAP transporter small permease [Gammaproteobacteria bacterium]
MIGNFFNRIEEALISFLLAAMTIVTFTQVVLRYVFNAGFVWALELTIFLFAWLVLLGMSYGVRVGSHIGVDLVVKNLPPVQAKVVGLISIALCMFYAAVMAYGGYQDIDLLLLIGIEAEDLPIPLWIPKLILPIGFLLLFLRFAQAGWNLLTGKGGLHLADEADEAIESLSDKGASAEAEARKTKQ